MIRLAGTAMALALTSVSVAGIGALILREFPEAIEAASEVFQAPKTTDVEALLDGVDAITLSLRSRTQPGILLPKPKYNVSSNAVLIFRRTRRTEHFVR